VYLGADTSIATAHRQVASGRLSAFRYEKLSASTKKSQPNRYLATNLDDNLSFIQLG